MTPDSLFGLEPLYDDRTSFVLSEPLVRFDGQLFGGTGLGVVVAVMEAATDRHALWATVQFVDTAAEGDRLDVVVEELAHGGTTSQVRVTVTKEDKVVLAGLGSTARSREGGFGAEFGTMPQVPAPEECTPLTFGFANVPPEMRARGPFSIGTYRVAPGAHESQLVWVHLDDRTFTRSLCAYVADFIPSAVLGATGRFGGGTSLDNAMRFGPQLPDDCEWLLLESDPYFAQNGFVHGAARIWTPQGSLVAVASQSAIARVFGG